MKNLGVLSICELMWRAVHCKLYICMNVACSRLRDSGEKAFSKKKCEKRAGAGERASYFRFARFNTSALYYHSESLAQASTNEEL